MTGSDSVYMARSFPLAERADGEISSSSLLREQNIKGILFQRIWHNFVVEISEIAA